MGLNDFENHSNCHLRFNHTSGQMDLHSFECVIVRTSWKGFTMSLGLSVSRSLGRAIDVATSYFTAKPLIAVAALILLSVPANAQVPPPPPPPPPVGWTDVVKWGTQLGQTWECQVQLMKYVMEVDPVTGVIGMNYIPDPNVPPDTFTNMTPKYFTMTYPGPVNAVGAPTYVTYSVFAGGHERILTNLATGTYEVRIRQLVTPPAGPPDWVYQPSYFIYWSRPF